MEDSECLEIEILASVPELRKVLQDKYDIHIPQKCDKFLARCLRTKDGNLEKAIEFTRKFKAMILEAFNWKVSLRPKDYKPFYDTCAVFPLKTRDSENHRVIILQLSKWDPNMLSCAEYLMAVSLQLQYAVSHSLDDQRNGLVVIYDCSSVSLQQICAINTRKLITSTTYLRSGCIGRLKECHVVNYPTGVGLVYTSIKPFLSTKMKKRIQLHKTLDRMLEALLLDSSKLPIFLGGQMETEECVDKEFMEQFINDERFFLDMFETGFPTQ